MTLSVIGTGFGRTGTLSMKAALEQLGFGPCHHMMEVRQNPDQIAHWEAAADDRPVNWSAVFAKYRSAVDWPSARYWRALVDHYPDAKVILTARDPESWYRSICKTIFVVMKERANIDDPARRRVMNMAYRTIVEQTFDDRLDDRDHAIAVYKRHVEAVIATVPRERLLVMEVAEGWAPLCRHLGCAVPDGPFPRSNSTEEFWERLAPR